eukprot:265412_1
MITMKKIGVILSGCGVYDGSEIHEAVLTLLAISRSGAQAVCFAPDKQQVDVINHLTGEAMTETRNVLIEAARITIPLTLRHLQLLRRITRTENSLHRNITRRQSDIQNSDSSTSGIR